MSATSAAAPSASAVACASGSVASRCSTSLREATARLENGGGGGRRRPVVVARREPDLVRRPAPGRACVRRCREPALFGEHERARVGRDGRQPPGHADDPGRHAHVLEVEDGPVPHSARGRGEVRRHDHRHRPAVGRLRRTEGEARAGVREREGDPDAPVRPGSRSRPASRQPRQSVRTRGPARSGPRSIVPVGRRSVTSASVSRCASANCSRFVSAS